jgi:hypothetical protein
MAKPFRGAINVDVTPSVPDWGPYTQPIAPEGTPSVLYIVLADVGYSAASGFPSSNGHTEQVAESTEPVPAGHVVLSAEARMAFMRD